MLIIKCYTNFQPDWPKYCTLLAQDYSIAFNLNLDYHSAGYCALSTQDYSIAFNLNLSNDSTNFCSLIIPDQNFSQQP